MASTALAASLILGAGTSVASSITQSSAAQTAAGEQANAAQQGLNFEQQVYNGQQQTQLPFVQSGVQALGDLADPNFAGSPYQLQNIKAPGAFVAPTLQQAQQTPGYQFIQQQGDQGILAGAAAAGGNINGATLKGLESYNSNLANTSYSNIFNQQLAGYGANLQDYQAQLQRQQQGFSQLFSQAGLGETGAANVNATGTSAAQTVASLLGNIGNAQAAGTIGSANATANGLSGVANSATNALLLQQLGLTGSGTSGVTSAIPQSQAGINANVIGSSPIVNPTLANLLVGQGNGPGGGT